MPRFPQGEDLEKICAILIREPDLLDPRLARASDVRTRLEQELGQDWGVPSPETINKLRKVIRVALRILKQKRSNPPPPIDRILAK